MNHKRQSHYFCLALLSTCLIGSQAMAAAEELNDQILMDCVFKHRDTKVNADGSFKRVHVSDAINPVNGHSGGLRLYEPVITSRTRFSMTWRTYDFPRNSWYISPDHAAKCVAESSNGFRAEECTGYDYFYLTVNDGYYVIHHYMSGSDAWQAPADPNGIGFLTSGTFRADAPLSERRRFHWEIKGCKNIMGDSKSPAP